MEHDGFMTGMMLGGALVAAIPTLLVIGVGVYVLRQHRARLRADAAAATPPEEVSQ
jgi:hypothetical protein